MSPGGTLTAEDLEFLTMALRRAQAYFAHPIDRSTVAQRKSTFEPAGVFMGTIRLQINPSSPSCACAIISFEYIQVLTAHRSCLLARSPYFKLCFEDSQIYTRKKLWMCYIYRSVSSLLLLHQIRKPSHTWLWLGSMGAEGYLEYDNGWTFVGVATRRVQRSQARETLQAMVPWLCWTCARFAQGSARPQPLSREILSPLVWLPSRSQKLCWHRFCGLRAP